MYTITCSDGSDSATSKRQAMELAKNRRNTTLGNWVRVSRADEAIAAWSKSAEGRGNKWVRVNP